MTKKSRQEHDDRSYKRGLENEHEDGQDDESDGLEDATTEAQVKVKRERAALMKQRNAVKTKKWRDKQRRRQDQQKDDLTKAEATVIELQEENAKLRKTISDMQSERKRAERKQKSLAAAVAAGRHSEASIEKTNPHHDTASSAKSLPRKDSPGIVASPVKSHYEKADSDDERDAVRPDRASSVLGKRKSAPEVETRGRTTGTVSSTSSNQPTMGIPPSFLSAQSMRNLSELHQRNVQDDVTMRAQMQSLIGGGTPLGHRVAPGELNTLDFMLRQLQPPRGQVDSRLISAAGGNPALAGQLASILYGGGPPSLPGADTMAQGATAAAAAPLAWQGNPLLRNNYLDHPSLLQPSSRGSHEEEMLKRQQQPLRPQPGHAVAGDIDSTSALLLRHYLQQGGGSSTESNQDVLNRIALLEGHVLRSRLPSNIAPNGTPGNQFQRH